MRKGKKVRGPSFPDRMLSRLWNAAANDTVGGSGGHATTVLRGYGGAQAYGGAFSGSVADRYQ